MLHPKHSSLFSLPLLLFIHYFHPSESAILQSLNSDDVDGATWTLQNTNLSISILAHVPGSAHLDLLAQGVIEEPYVGLNVDNYRWIKDEEYWMWSGTFIPSAGILSSDEIQFVAEGIDTVATIHLNGISILNTSNAFITKTLLILTRLG
jgi:beta-mannosidase